MLFSSHNNVSSKSNITDFNIILSSFIIYLIFLFLLYYGIYNLSLSPSFFILIEESYFVMNLSLLNLKRSILYVIICYRLRSEEHTSELQSRGHLVCRLLLEKKKKNINVYILT